MLIGNGVECSRIYTAIDAGYDVVNTANFFDTGTDEEGSRQLKGRKHAIDNGRLWGQRDALLFLIEITWPDIGARLARIKTAAEVLDLLKVWEIQNRHSANYVAQVLLRQSSISATAANLSEKRRRGGELHRAYLDAVQRADECRKSLETAQRAHAPDLSADDRAAVEEQVAKRTEKLASAEKDLAIAKKRSDDMQAIIEQGEAYFARSEFARFCKSKRYRITPLNLANALAGLPFISWRQSLERCQEKECPGLNGGAMKEFDAIRRIVQSGTRKSQLVRHAQQWLRSKGKAEPLTVGELRKNWYYLRKAIQSALDARTRTRDLPFVITKDYRERHVRASNVDRLFAEEEAL